MENGELGAEVRRGLGGSCHPVVGSIFCAFTSPPRKDHHSEVCRFGVVVKIKLWWVGRPQTQAGTFVSA